jgi:uncharacterized coiled-coil protein SlyX
MNNRLAQELKDLAAADLAKRAELATAGTLFDGYHPDMEALHIANARRLENLIEELGGWPHAGVVGSEGAEAAWLVAQHAISLPDFQRRVLGLLKENEGAVPPAQVAHLEDRIRRFEGRPQLYGTQVDWDENGKLSPGVIEDEANVDKRRAQVGLKPLAERLADMQRNAAAEGEKPPVDAARKRKEAEAWMKKTGWR